MCRKRAYAVYIHRQLKKTVNGVARELGVAGRTIRGFFNGEPKRLSFETEERLRVLMEFNSRRAWERQLEQWRQ